MTDHMISTIKKVIRKPLANFMGQSVGNTPGGALSPDIYQGFVDERSRFHVAGWVRNLENPADRPIVEAVLPSSSGMRVLARGAAAEFSDVLTKIGIGDGCHAFFLAFDNPLPPGDDSHIVVRVADTAYELPRAPSEKRTFTPISHIAIDIVNNCNLRCPFCVYDYANTRSTKFMSEETFRNIMPIFPYVADANIWLSCLHEPTLHPQLIDFIEMVPDEHRRKIFFTSNLAKRQKIDFFETLGKSGINHINVSVESFDRDIYEKMRKGARYDIFMENLGKMKDAFSRSANPPKVRFISTVFRSNADEIPDLVEMTRTDYGAWQNEIRAVFDMPYTAQNFKDEEYIDIQKWNEIKGRLSKYSSDDVVVIDPQDPATEETTAPDAPQGKVRTQLVPRPLNIRVDWSGNIYVYGPYRESDEQGNGFTTDYVASNVNRIRNLTGFINSL